MMHVRFNVHNKKRDIPIMDVHFKKGGILESLIIQGFPVFPYFIQSCKEKTDNILLF